MGTLNTYFVLRTLYECIDPDGDIIKFRLSCPMSPSRMLINLAACFTTLSMLTFKIARTSRGVTPVTPGATYMYAGTLGRPRANQVRVREPEAAGGGKIAGQCQSMYMRQQACALTVLMTERLHGSSSRSSRRVSRKPTATPHRFARGPALRRYALQPYNEPRLRRCTTFSRIRIPTCTVRQRTRFPCERATFVAAAPSDELAMAVPRRLPLIPPASINNTRRISRPT
jgi:hypothetical protein